MKNIFTVLVFSICAAVAAQSARNASEFVFKSGMLANPSGDFPENTYMVLCYHDVPNKITDDKDAYAVELQTFVQHLDFLKSQKCSFISTDDILKAKSGEAKLPEKAVLLTFDDAYESFYKNVFPVLKIYRCPAVLAVVCEWIDNPPDDPEYRKKFMTWDQLREVAASGLVNVASHSYRQHKSVLMNPLGSMTPAIQTRIYDPARKEYETDSEYRKRVFDDLKKSSSMIQDKTGVAPDVMVWPYGRYNQASVEEAKKAGFKFTFKLNVNIDPVFTPSYGMASPVNTDLVPRFMITDNPPVDSFSVMFKRFFTRIERLRIVQNDLDSIYDPDPEKLNKNIDAFIERIFRLKPSAIYLQAFCDKDGDGNVSSVYFPNRILPVKADIFSRVARSVFIRGIQVYAWMPTMAFVLPDEKENERLRVCEFRDGVIRPSTSLYKRLSPFSEEACGKIEAIYEDLAAYSDFDGIVFQDDAYMNDYEDFSPEAMREYVKISGDPAIPFQKLDAGQKAKWTDLKTERIMELTDRIKKKVLYYRPEARFARTLYPKVLLEPESEECYSQNYRKTLCRYDYAIVMAYPRTEGVWWFNEKSWLRSLVRKASEYPYGLDKTVFKTQAYDWKREKWIDSDTVDKWLRVLAAAGACGIAYYPDSYAENRPENSIIMKMISAKDTGVSSK